MNRPHSLDLAGIGAVSSAAAAPSSVKPLSAGEHSVGIQLYTMQTSLVHDFEGTLTALARTGYRAVEPVALLGHDARNFRAALDKAGLTAPSIHVVSAAAQRSFLDMASGRLATNEAWERIHASMDIGHIEPMMEETLAQSEVLGNEYLVMGVADSGLFECPAGVEKVIAAYSKAGDLCHRRGLKFAFHPHLAEFNRVAGLSAIDQILGMTDPHRVFVELDFFWAAMAGVDVPRLLRRYNGRFPLGHIKDMSRDVIVPAGGFKGLSNVTPGSFEDVGYGQLDYGCWIPLARRAGMRHFFLERDEAPDPLGSAKRSFPKLKELLSWRPC
jgi:sugar phosphate isomerase/epimerase